MWIVLWNNRLTCQSSSKDEQIKVERQKTFNLPVFQCQSNFFKSFSLCNGEIGLYSTFFSTWETYLNNGCCYWQINSFFGMLPSKQKCCGDTWPPHWSWGLNARFRNKSSRFPCFTHGAKKNEHCDTNWKLDSFKNQFSFVLLTLTKI
jgi:hypothetical protein